MIVTLKDFGQIGLIKDLHPSELPINAFSDAQNVKFRNGYLERVEGYASLPATSGAPYGLQPLTKSDGTKYWVYPQLTAIRVTDFTTDTNITRSSGGAYTGTADNRWVTDVFAGIFVGTNGVDLPQFWAGVPATPCATLTGWDTSWRANFLRATRNFLFAGNFLETSTRYPFRVRCSTIAESGTLPSTWTPAASNFARSWDLADSPGHVIDAMPLGDQMVVYKEDSYYAFQFIGGTEVFRIQRISDQYGLHTQNCVAEFPGGHIVLGNGEVYTHAGGAPQPLLNGRVSQLLFSSWDTTYSKRSFVVTHQKKQEVWICYPSLGSTTCNKAIIWNWNDNTFGVMDLPTCTAGANGRIGYSTSDLINNVSSLTDDVSRLIDSSDYSPSENRLLLASAGASKIYIIGVGSDFDGSSISSYVLRTGLHLDAPSTYKAISWARPRIVNAPDAMTFSITLGTQKTQDGAISWNTPQTYTHGTTRQVTSITQMGPYLAYKIATTYNSYYRLKSMDMKVMMGGNF